MDYAYATSISLCFSVCLYVCLVVFFFFRCSTGHRQMYFRNICQSVFFQPSSQVFYLDLCLYLSFLFQYFFLYIYQPIIGYILFIRASLAQKKGWIGKRQWMYSAQTLSRLHQLKTTGGTVFCVEHLRYFSVHLLMHDTSSPFV